MNTLDWILDIPRRQPDRAFLIDPVSGKTFTFGDLHRTALAVAADLRRRGFRRADKLAILLNNSVEFAELYFGCLYAGVVTVPINPALAQKEIGFIIQHSGAKGLVVSRETVGQADRALLAKAGINPWMLLDGRGQGEIPRDVPSWDFSRLGAAKSFKPFDGASADDTMTIVYTSGTTARPSGVVHRIADLVENARFFNRRVGIGPENRFYGILAMTYLGGYYNLLLLPYAAGASVVLGNAFDARSALDFWRPAREHGVNTLWLVPTIMAILMEMDRGTEGEEFCRQNVRLSLVGTAPLPVSLRKNFEERYGVTLFENYGLSETLFISTNAPSLPVVDAGVGRLLPGVQATVLGEDGKAVPYGAEGEISVCTPTLMEGYHDPETHRPQALDRGDWFPTGDIGVMSETGDLFITGRKKDLIIRRGVNVSPAAIENVLQTHPAVAECAVVGVPHAIYGEDIVAVVSLRRGHPFSEVQPALIQSCKENLGAIKQPSHVLEVEAFPKSASGKIQKAKVRDMLVQKMGLAHLLAPRAPTGSPPASAPPAILPGRVKRKVVRPPADLVAELRRHPLSIVTDVMNRMGAMHAGLRAVVPGRPFGGPAVTVEESEGNNLMTHLALEMVQPGDVLVIDAKGGMTRSCWGGLQTRKAKDLGVAAVVVYGTVRDHQDIVECGLPVYALGISPAGPLKGWGGNINCPVSCGGVAVLPGDIVLGGDDGVIVVPQEVAKLLPPMCERRRREEDGWFERAKAGEATLDAVGIREKLQRLGLRFE